jgi:hypothetical protein
VSAEPEDLDAAAPGEDEDVDLDLDLIDDQLRKERLGRPTSVRIDNVVVHVLHAGDWSSEAMQAASVGNWEAWAEAVIPDKEEYEHWLEADLRNYQVEAVFAECGRQARMSMGKSRRPSGSRGRSRRK